jgi:hypothetical protein
MTCWREGPIGRDQTGCRTGLLVFDDVGGFDWLDGRDCGLRPELCPTSPPLHPNPRFRPSAPGTQHTPLHLQPILSLPTVIMQSFRAASTVARLAARPTTLSSLPRLAPTTVRLISSTSRSEATPTASHPRTEPPAQYPDYSKGPSALDKASSQFFFTEILRGEPSHHLAPARLKVGVGGMLI